MKPGTAPIVLCGPQRARVTAGHVVRRLAPEGPIATITAGWREREREDAELDQVMGGRSVNLALYQRAERVWRAHPELREAHRTLQDRLRLLRRSYDIQLGRRMEAWSALEDLDGDPAVLQPERADALDAIRRLDQRHLARVVELRDEYLAETRPFDHPIVQREREELAGILDRAKAVAIAGGHVAVLVNRCRMFGLADLLGDTPIVAWSAGAMALTDRIVLFHDSPPQGAGNAEAFDHGLGLARGIVVLPHANERLHLHDPGRTGRFARRFAPALCVLLDTGEAAERTAGRWLSVESARFLTPDGAISELAA